MADSIKITIEIPRAVVRDVMVAAVEIGAIYAGYRIFRGSIDAAVTKAFGGERSDQKVEDIKPGSLHVVLRCFTDERFLEVLEDIMSGKMKERLQQEFSKIGIKTEETTVEITNKGEVEERVAAIQKSKTQGQELRIIVQGGAYNRSSWSSNIVEKQYLKILEISAKKGYEILKAGGNAVDAVEAAVRVLEDNEYFDAGYGSLLNNDGEVECDAMIMDGSTLATGAVISGRHFRNPVSLAKKIMNDTHHCALSAEGASKYAIEQGFPTCEPIDLISQHAKNLEISSPNYPDYIKLRFGGHAIQVTKSPQHTASADAEGTSKTSKDIPSGSTEETTQTSEVKGSAETKETGGALGSDTVSAVARDAYGRLACAVSTGGIPGRLKGRVSDASMVGCGGYANEHGAATTSGVGEYLIKMTLAREVVYLMEGGMNVQEAAENALKKMRDKFQESGVGGGVIAIDKEGNIGKCFTTDMMGWVSIKDEKLEYGLNHPMEI